jgi:hypothetical protein
MALSYGGNPPYRLSNKADKEEVLKRRVLEFAERYESDKVSINRLMTDRHELQTPLWDSQDVNRAFRQRGILGVKIAASLLAGGAILVAAVWWWPL